MIRVARTFRLVPVVMMSGLISVSAPANDTAYTGYSGQIQFVKNSSIVLQKEVLEITSKPPMVSDIKVSYIFKNETEKPVTVDIAFPLPEADVAACVNGFSAHESCDTPEMKLLADKKIINGKWKVSFVVSGKEISLAPKLTEIPGYDNDHYCDIPANDPGFKCSEAQKNFCEKLKKETKKENCEAAMDSLTMRRTYLWTYTFQPGKTTSVVHQYSAARGGVSGVVGDNNLKDHFAKDLAFGEDPFCFKDFSPKVRAAISKSIPRWTKYTLKTGANWKGPIQNFELVINKTGSEMISSCFPGLKKIAPNVFKAAKNNFVPDTDILVGFFIPPEQK
jgi:hypothetical protein